MLHRAVFLCAGLVLIAGCTPRLCDDHLSTSGRITVRVLDIERENGQFKYNPGRTGAYVDSTGSCTGFDGLVADSSLELRVTGTADDPNHTCRRITASVVSLPSPTVLTGDNPRAPAKLPVAGDLYGGADVTIQDCPGQIFLELFGASEKGPYSTPVAGEAPPEVLYRLFFPSAACSRICDDNFAVQLAPS
jgi:hypothetical protein